MSEPAWKKNFKVPWREQYEAGKNAGFEVESVREFIGNEKTGQRAVSMRVKTPYFYEGKPVTGWGVVGIQQNREATDMEFWAEGRNIEDIEPGKTPDFYTGEGYRVFQRDAREDMGQFLRAASEYPHVATYEEFMELQTYMSRKRGLDAPTAENYQGYLNHVEKQMLSGDVEFVGEMKSRQDLVQARLSVGDATSDFGMDNAFSGMEL